ncbi:MAG: virginiamycin B lyase family protein [Solirubrobacteraceae bacterium]
MADNISCTAVCTLAGPNGADLYAASVYIYQEPTAVPKVSFNETTPFVGKDDGAIFEEAPNALSTCQAFRASEYAPWRPSVCSSPATGHIWLGPDTGAIEVKAEDPGVGISELEVFSTTGTFKIDHRFLEEAKCSGVQCFPKLSEPITYNTTMPEGEVHFAAHAKDSIGMSAEGALSAPVYVDAKPPAISVGGALNGEEIGPGESKIEVKATDGEGTTVSSGVRSIRLEIEGKKIGEEEGSCEPGPCTATGTWTIHGASFSAGKHQLVVTATDNANNVSREVFPFRIHAVTPLAAGPGQVDPSSGELTLEATDVSLPGGLGVSRSYGSEHTTSGANGPLGRQWRMSLGGEETLSELPEGSVELNGASGAETVFTKTAKNAYEDPRGDQNLKLEATEKEGRISGYVLKNPKDGTQTTFTQPSGWAPTPTFQTHFGSAGTGSGQFAAPSAIAEDAEGDIWVADYGNNRVEEFSEHHVFIRSIGSKGSGEGQMEGPWGVAVNKQAGLLYVTDQGNHRVDVYSVGGAFIRSFSAPAPEAFGTLAGIAVSASGSLYVVDNSNDRIDVFSSTGEYQSTIAPPAPHALTGPNDVAIGEKTVEQTKVAHIYVTDSGAYTVEELGEKGEWLKSIGEKGEAPGDFKSLPYQLSIEPSSGKLYVTDVAGSRVDVFSEEGSFLTAFGAAGGQAGGLSGDITGVSASARGQVFLVNAGANEIQEWEVPAERAVFEPTIAQGTTPPATQTFSFGTIESGGQRIVVASEELAPQPEGVMCEGRPSEEKGGFKPGCRALFFQYATTTEAKGNAPGEWGSVAGQLEKVIYAAAGQGGKVEEKAVAEYAYDASGRLRAEWDPRISPALKTTYSYTEHSAEESPGEEGLITSLSAPGTEPWYLTYGRGGEDLTPGRLQKFRRAPASEALASPAAPKNETAPAISGSPDVGVRMGVSKGTWSESPAVYSFQWERCSAVGQRLVGSGCVAIAGAIDQNYTPTAADAGRALRVTVRATNAGGTSTALSGESAEVNETALSLPESRAATSVIEGPEGDVWFTASGGAAKIGRLTSTGEQSEYPLGSGVVSASAITTGPEGDLWFAEATSSGEARIGRITIASHEVKEYSLPNGVSPTTFAEGPEGDLWFTSARWTEKQGQYGWTQRFIHSTIGKLVPAGGGEVTQYKIAGEQGEYGGALFSPPHGGGITRGANGDLYLTEPNANAIAQITPATDEQKLITISSGHSTLGSGVLTGPEGDIYAGTGGGVLQMTPEGKFTEHGTKYGGEPPARLSLGSDNDLYLVHGWRGFGYGIGGAVLQRMSLAGQVLGEYPLASGGAEGEAALGSEGDVYFQSGEGVFASFGKLALGSQPGTPAEAKAPQPGSTIAYNVPVSGQAAAHEGAHFYAGGRFWVLSASTVDTHGDVWAVGLGFGVNAGKVVEYSPAGQELHEYPTGFCLPTNVTADRSGNVWVPEILCNKVQEYSAEGKLVRSFFATGGGLFGFPVGIAPDSKGHIYGLNLYVGYESIKEFSEEGSYIGSFASHGSGSGQLNDPRAITIDSQGNIWIADAANNRIDEFSAEHQWIKAIGYGVADGQSRPETCTTTCEAGIAGSAPGQFSGPMDVSVNEAGDLFVADTANGRIEQMNGATGAFMGFIGGHYSETGTGLAHLQAPTSVSLDGEGNLWISDAGTAQVAEYQLPAGALGAPNALGEGEAAAWGQHDTPVEATAIYPPTHPQASPPSDYSAATIAYLDREGHVVNTATPTGAISMAEYNEDGEVTRSLSADARIAALAAGEGPPKRVCKVENGELSCTNTSENSVKVAEHLSSESRYNLEGTELLETIGPEHEVTLTHALGSHSAGQRLGVRSFTTYSYDEGAPESERYGLATKTVSGIVDEAGEEGEKRETTTSYAGEEGLGWKLRAPTSVTSEPQGKKQSTETIYYSEKAEAGVPACENHPEAAGMVCETRGALSQRENVPAEYAGQAGAFGTAPGDFAHPLGIAIDSAKDLWVTDSQNNRVQKLSQYGAPLESFGTKGSSETELTFSEPAGIAINQATHDVYVADTANDRVVELSEKGALVRTFAKHGAAAGELASPEGIATDSEGNLYVADRQNHRIDSFSAQGAFRFAFGFGVQNGEAKLESCTSASGCRAGLEGAEAGEPSAPGGIAVSANRLYLSDSANDRVIAYELKGTEAPTISGDWGTMGSGEGQLMGPAGLAVAANGNVLVADSGNDRIDVFSSAGAFKDSFGQGGSGAATLASPEGLAVGEGEATYVVDTGANRLELFSPPRTALADSQTVYYTPAGEASVEGCRNRPEWAGLPCLTHPMAQPQLSWMPKLPEVHSAAYNLYAEPIETIESFPSSATRTTKKGYDEAGRETVSEVSASTGKALPVVKKAYSPISGALETQTSEEGEATKTITSKLNFLGEPESYTDASGTLSTFTYDEYGRLVESREGVSGQSAVDEQKLTYDQLTGAVTKLKTEAGIFAATYDPEGRMTEELYPNGMSAQMTYTPTGEETKISYLKGSCTSECLVYSDQVSSGPRGEAVGEASESEKTASGQSAALTLAYAYDALGRLNEVKETPAGKNCAARLYAYDEEGNRVSQTTRESQSAKCEAMSERSSEGHVYDEAGRLSDPGVAYDALGNMTEVPGADAGGQALRSTFYADSQVATQSQSEKVNSELIEKTLEYAYDPAGRTLTQTTKGAGTLTDHYAGPSGTAAFTSEGSIDTLQIAGLDGSLDATKKSGEVASLLIHDLKGNVVGSVEDKEGTAGYVLQSAYDPTEFGVPSEGVLPKSGFGWLGAGAVKQERASGVVTEGGSSYVPEIGRALQADFINPPGADAEGGYSGAPYVTSLSLGAVAAQVAWGAGAPGREAVRQEEKARKAREEAERAEGGEGAEVARGSFALVSECVSSGACAASHATCGVTWEMKEVSSGTMGLVEEVACSQRVEGIGWAVCGRESAMLGSGPNWGYGYRNVDCTPKAQHGGLSTYDHEGIEQYIQFACTPGKVYSGWVWGRAWDRGGIVWSTPQTKNGAEERQTVKCKNSGGLGDLEKLFLEAADKIWG